MRSNTKAVLIALTYICSVLCCLGLHFFMIAILPVYTFFDVSHLTVFAASLVGAIPLSLLIYPAASSLYVSIQSRRGKIVGGAALSVVHSMQILGDKMPETGGAIFILRNDERLTVVNASRGFWNLIQCTAEELMTEHAISFLSFVVDEDVEKVRNAISANGSSFIPQFDFRIRKEGVYYKWCKLYGVKDIDAKTKTSVSNCIALDVTESKLAENALVVEKERYRLLLTNITSAMWQYDVASDTLSIAKGSDKENDFVPVEDYRTTLIRSGDIHPDHIEAFNELCDNLKSGAEHVSGELMMKSHSGKYGWYSVFGACIRDAQGAVVSYLGQIKNTNNEHKIQDQLKLQNEIDPLTRLNNRYAFVRYVDALIAGAGARRSGALFIIDVDDFVKINDNLGRLFGDALLIELSAALKNIFSSDCVFGRIGGDEFVVYADYFACEGQIKRKAADVCGCVSHCFLNTEQTESVTCSVGVARFPIDGKTCEQLFYKADTALVLSKYSGKNTFSLYADGMDECISELYDKLPARNRLGVVATALKEADLLSQAIEILFDSRELSSSINLIISLIGRRFGVDRISIIELSKENNAANVSYQWNSELVSTDESRPRRFSHEDGLKFIICSSDDEYYFTDDIEALIRNQPSLREVFCDLGVKSILQCLIREGVNIRGCMNFAICRDNVSLGKESINEIALIAKIVAGYLVRLRAQQDVDMLSHTDKLTGAMNYISFKAEAENLIRSKPDDRRAVVYFDIDRFKFINETYGYSVGDEILIAISRLFEKNLKKDEVFARVTADKFIAFLCVREHEDIEQRISSIHKQVNSIKKTDSDHYYIPMRSGVYLAGKGETDVSAMVDKANLARKSVKNIHTNTIAFYEESLKDRIKRQKEIEEVMLDALRGDEFVVYYQPKFSLSREGVVGAEALVRWNRAGIGILKPDEFIPVFEDNGFVVELDFYVLEKVCKKLRSDIDKKAAPMPISVNFSRVHLGCDDFISRIKSCIDKYELPSNLVEIEITESALTDNEDYLTDVMNSLHGIGLIISMDDFGSGYSSLNLLKKLPVDVLKLDRNFFDARKASERERCIIANIVNMAKELGISVVAEGVETDEQAGFLRNIKCDVAQGFLFERPMDESSFEQKYQNSGAVN